MSLNTLSEQFGKDSRKNAIEPNFKQRCLKYIFGNLYGGLYQYEPMDHAESSEFMEEIRHEAEKAKSYNVILDFIQVVFEVQPNEEELKILLS